MCGKLHEKRFKIYETVPIPAHPRCRCCIIPVVEPNNQLVVKDNRNQLVPVKNQPLTLQNNNVRITYTDEQLIQLTKIVEQINPKIGKAINYRHIEITELGKHGEKRLLERGVTPSNAQRYIDNAICCFQQGKDKVYYLSDDGVTVVSFDGRIMTTYSKDWFDDKTREIIKAVKKYGKRN